MSPEQQAPAAGLLMGADPDHAAPSAPQHCSPRGTSLPQLPKALDVHYEVTS